MFLFRNIVKFLPNTSLIPPFLSSNLRNRWLLGGRPASGATGELAEQRCTGDGNNEFFHLFYALAVYFFSTPDGARIKRQMRIPHSVGR